MPRNVESKYVSTIYSLPLHAFHSASVTTLVA